MRWRTRSATRPSSAGFSGSGLAIERLFDIEDGPDAAAALYAAPAFPAPPAGRPWIYANTVVTLDGKTTIGPAGGGSGGVGGPTDQILMRRLEAAADAVLIGAGTLRASQVIYAPGLLRCVLSAGGPLPGSNRFFADAPERAWVVGPPALPEPSGLPPGVRAARFGRGASFEAGAAAAWMRRELGVERLLVEGGSGALGVFFEAGLVDEWFVTIAPRLKGGVGRTTMIGGMGLPDGASAGLEAVSAYRDGDELYLRYRTRRPAPPG